MDNSINNISFKATLKPLTRIKNRSAFMELKKLFEQKTASHPNDCLIITSSQSGEHSISIAGANFSDISISKDLFIEDFNEQLSSMSIKTLANKLVNDFNVLRMHYELTEEIYKLKKELNRAKALYKTNISLANAWRNDKKADIAERYNILATNNKQIIEKITDLLNSKIAKFNNYVENSAKTNSEIGQLKIRNSY